MVSLLVERRRGTAVGALLGSFGAAVAWLDTTPVAAAVASGIGAGAIGAVLGGLLAFAGTHLEGLHSRPGSLCAGASSGPLGAAVAGFAVLALRTGGPVAYFGGFMLVLFGAAGLYAAARSAKR